MIIELNYNQFESFKEKVNSANKLANSLNMSNIEYEYVTKEVLVGNHWFWGGGYKETHFEVKITKNIDVAFSRYEFVSFLESENGVVFSHTLPEKEIPTYYLTDAKYHGNCDHCHQKRKRKATYIIFDKEDKKYIQVGSSCMNDFLVSNVEKILRELFYTAKTIFEPEDEIYFQASSKKQEDTYPLINFLGMICSISKFGENYISKTVAEQKNIASTVSIFLEIIGYYSTKDEKEKTKYGKTYEYSDEKKEKIENLYNSIIPNEEHYSFVSKVIEWVDTLKNSRSEFEINLYNYFKIYKETGVPTSKLNWIASGINSYVKAHKKSETLKSVDGRNSEHVGEVGQRLTFKGKLKSIKFLNQNLNYLNLTTTNLITFEDEKGNIFTTFYTKTVDDLKAEEWYEVKGSVKKHDVFRDIKQTNIFRIKLKKVD